VLRLLTEMGYGNDAGSATHIGQTGDGGIDGTIAEDRLGLDTIYLQAKRWDPSRTVGRPDIQGFVGALQGQGASKGVFITTARFSTEAHEFVRTLPTPRVTLIDGTLLTDLMIENELGVVTERTFSLKRIDEDYFS
jgi:restriction system protein